MERSAHGAPLSSLGGATVRASCRVGTRRRAGRWSRAGLGAECSCADDCGAYPGMVWHGMGRSSCMQIVAHERARISSHAD